MTASPRGRPNSVLLRECLRRLRWGAESSAGRGTLHSLGRSTNRNVGRHSAQWRYQTQLFDVKQVRVARPGPGLAPGVARPPKPRRVVRGRVRMWGIRRRNASLVDRAAPSVLQCHVLLQNPLRERVTKLGLGVATKRDRAFGANCGAGRSIDSGPRLRLFRPLARATHRHARTSSSRPTT